MNGDGEGISQNNEQSNIVENKEEREGGLQEVE